MGGCRSHYSRVLGSFNFFQATRLIRAGKSNRLSVSGMQGRKVLAGARAGRCGEGGEVPMEFTRVRKGEERARIGGRNVLSNSTGKLYTGRGRLASSYLALLKEINKNRTNGGLIVKVIACGPGPHHVTVALGRRVTRLNSLSTQMAA